jgi:hypothetical protein
MSLEPCPFCGETKRIDVITGTIAVGAGQPTTWESFAACRSCNAQGPTQRSQFAVCIPQIEDSAAGFWNKRRAS